MKSSWWEDIESRNSFLCLLACWSPVTLKTAAVSSRQLIWNDVWPEEARIKRDYGWRGFHARLVSISSSEACFHLVWPFIWQWRYWTADHPSIFIQLRETCAHVTSRVDRPAYFAVNKNINLLKQVAASFSSRYGCRCEGAAEFFYRKLFDCSINASKKLLHLSPTWSIIESNLIILLPELVEVKWKI